VEYIAPSKPGSWSLVVKLGSSVAIGTALFTINVAFGLLAAFVRPPELFAPELEELELEPHAASRSTAAAAAVAARTRRLHTATDLLVDFIVPPSVVRVMRPPSLVRFIVNASSLVPVAPKLLDGRDPGQRASPGPSSKRAADCPPPISTAEARCELFDDDQSICNLSPSRGSVKDSRSNSSAGRLYASRRSAAGSRLTMSRRRATFQTD